MDDFDLSEFANFTFDDELTYDVSSPHSERPGSLPQQPDLFSSAHTEEILKRQAAQCEGLSGVGYGRGVGARLRRKGNASPIDSKSPPLQGLSLLKNFTGVQKKTTRGFCHRAPVVDMSLTPRQMASHPSEEVQNRTAGQPKHEGRS